MENLGRGLPERHEEPGRKRSPVAVLHEAKAAVDAAVEQLEEAADLLGTSDWELEGEDVKLAAHQLNGSLLSARTVTRTIGYKIGYPS